MATRRGLSVRSGDETPVLPGQLRSAPAGPGRRAAGRWRGAPGARWAPGCGGAAGGGEGKGPGPARRPPLRRPAPPAPARGAPPPAPSRRPALPLPAAARGRRSADSTAAADSLRTASRPRRRHPGARGGPGAGQRFHGDRLPARRDCYDTAGRPRPALPGATAPFLSSLCRGRTRGGGTQRAGRSFPFSSSCVSGRSGPEMQPRPAWRRPTEGSFVPPSPAASGRRWLEAATSVAAALNLGLRVGKLMSGVQYRRNINLLEEEGCTQDPGSGTPLL
ncbi:uncharacterized protein LOC116242162 [Phasianus colchicus]|uniref:uncharacterized protein LOC116242162 n=1 Tax=Phasianus colchicus TaxID=9054 RepID=UPI00129E3C6E|nr:uncharacterized protein LOC116242162 [Phasianus colchicus]